MSTFFEQIGERILPIAAKYDTEKLPPTYQDFLESPQVQQSQMLSSFQMLQQVARAEQAEQEQVRRMKKLAKQMRRRGR